MKNKVLSILFCIFIFSFFILNIIIKDLDVSYSERRKLASLPDFNLENIMNGSIFDRFEEYALDHFVLRDEFRFLKASFDFNILKHKDYNNLYFKDGYIYKIEYPLRENKVLNFSSKINKLYDNYLKGMNVYYSIIPDKNYYVSSSYLKLDYDKLIKIVNESISSDIEYIDITDRLDINSYYHTDIHWRQEKIASVVKRLSEKMDFKLGDSYFEHKYEPFYGSYYGQIGLKVPSDDLIYLTSDTIDSASVWDFESDLKTVYEVSSLSSNTMDCYDVFLGGATPIVKVKVKNPASSGKDLIIFRDSFGSSIAPLMLEGYDSITLIDLRYIDSSLLNEYVEFTNQDVLILYNTTIINNSDMLKIR